MNARRDPPSSGRALADRLRNLCRDRGVPEGRARRLVGIVVLGQLLDQTGVGVIKGASNLEVRIGTGHTRASSDLDTVYRRSLEDFREQLAATLRQGWAGFGGTVADQGQIAAPVPLDYRPHRLRVKLEYRGANFTSVTVEVAPEEVDALAELDHVGSREAEEWFAELGLPAPGAVPMLPLAHQIAQKLHACTAPDTDGWHNERVHDLIDLQLAMDLFAGDLAQIRTAAVRLFDARQQHAWPPTVTPRSGWQDGYLLQAEGLEVLQDLDAAVAWTNELIETIHAATV